MKYSRAAVRCKSHAVPELQFEAAKLTSFSGLVVFQELFSHLELKGRLRSCFSHLRQGVYGPAVIVLGIVLHVLLGYRRLRESRYYADDPMIKRVLGVRRLPDVGTVSRALAGMDRESVERLRTLIRGMVIDRIVALGLVRVTMDFDGVVMSTNRHAEGTAVGFNKKKKGARSYYPLFCTIAQMGVVFDVFHRPGNVHDSNAAQGFIIDCIGELRRQVPGIIIEIRMDSAFFSDEIVTMLEERKVEFTASVPFERFSVLKGMIQGRKRWRRFNANLSFFETDWKPKAWDARYRFVFIRTRAKIQFKSPIQLDMFIPAEYGFEFKVIVTNKAVTAKKVMAFHNGRGYQEGIFAELKSHGHAEYVPSRRLYGNQIWLLSSIMAHNLTRELQMIQPRHRHTGEKRPPLWVFSALDTVRRTIVCRAGRFTRPKNKLVLTMSASSAVQKEILAHLAALKKAA